MAPAIASAIMLIAKIWDGVNDPMFGAIAERTNTKRGRFRPYILFGAPILAVLSVLAFTTIGREMRQLFTRQLHILDVAWLIRL